HHVLGRVLLRLDGDSGRPRALDRRRANTRAAPLEQELGRGGNDRPAVAVQRLRDERPERRERARKPERVAVEVGAQMLDEIHLVDVAFGDRIANGLDAVRVLALGPARVPRSDRVRARWGLRRLERIRDRGQHTGLRWSRRARAPERIRAAIADVDLRNRVVPAEEALVPERGLELGYRLELDGHAQTVRATCRSHSTPSSRSETGTRSSAEWMRVAARSGVIVRYGKKP